jgi:hypothetical protein
MIHPLLYVYVLIPMEKIVFTHNFFLSTTIDTLPMADMFVLTNSTPHPKSPCPVLCTAHKFQKIITFISAERESSDRMPDVPKAGTLVGI